MTIGGTASAQVGLNLAKLIEAKSLFGKADIDLDDPTNVLHMAITQNQLDDLLKEEKLTSNEYANVKALVNGDIDTFMGFKFIRIQRMPLAESIRTCVAWAKSGVKGGDAQRGIG